MQSGLLSTVNRPKPWTSFDYLLTVVYWFLRCLSANAGFPSMAAVITMTWYDAMLINYCFEEVRRVNDNVSSRLQLRMYWKIQCEPSMNKKTPLLNVLTLDRTGISFRFSKFPKALNFKRLNHNRPRDRRGSRREAKTIKYAQILPVGLLGHWLS